MSKNDKIFSRHMTICLTLLINISLFFAFPPYADALSGDGTAASPYIVSSGADLDDALITIGEDYYDAGGSNVSDMHYIELTDDIDAVTSSTYGDEDADHPVRVTIEGNGHTISSDIPIPDSPTHTSGTQYTGLRFANRTPYSDAGRGNHIVLKNLTVRGLYNAETHGGGAVSMFGGKLEVENCLFEGNAAFGTSRGGGAILLQHRASVLSVKNSTFIDNSSVAPGGAIDSSGDQDNVTPGANVMIENSTFYGNKTTGTTGSNGPGGAVSFGRALGSITNCTIVGNAAANGKAGGVYARYNISGNPSGLGAKVNIALVNSIVAGNGVVAGYTDVDLSNYDAPSSCDITGGYNVIGKVFDGFSDSGTTTGVSVSEFLQEGKPRVNEKGTPTIALLRTVDSPAVDKADPSKAPQYDQRGFPRVEAPDIGAFELQPQSVNPPVTPPDVPEDETAPGDDDAVDDMPGENPPPAGTPQEVNIGGLPETGIISHAPIPLTLDSGETISNPLIPPGDPGKTALKEIGVTVEIVNGQLVISGQAQRVGDFTVTVAGADGEGNRVTKEYVVKIEPHDVPNASGIVTDNPRQTVTTTLTGDPASPSATLVIQTRVSQEDARDAMSYSGTRFEITGTGSGIRITGGQFVLSGERGAGENGVPLEISGSLSGADLSGVTLDTVTYVAGINRYRQNVGIKLAETNVVDDTPAEDEGGSGGGGGSSGCDAGAAGAAAIAAVAFMFARRSRKG
jgi:hypothetical protein